MPMIGPVLIAWGAAPVPQRDGCGIPGRTDGEPDWSVTLHSERSQKIENGLLVRDREAKESLHHGIRLGRRVIFGRRREMLDDGLQEVAGPPVVEEEQPLADAPERRGSEFTRPGSTLDDVVGKSCAHM